MRKKCSVLLALVMFLSGIVFPGLFDEEAMAAVEPNYGLDASFGKTLKEGRNSDNPELAYEELKNANAYLEWEFDTYQGSSLMSGDYILQYPLADGMVAQFHVKKDGNTAAVEYRIMDAILTPGTGQLYSITHPSANNMNSFYVYARGEGPYNTNNYIRYTDYDNAGRTYGYWIETPATNGPGNEPDYPTFHINKNQGFSFSFGNRKVHFHWMENGKFAIKADSFEQSKVYPAKLWLDTKAAPDFISDPQTLNISTGIRLEDMQARALAKTGSGQAGMERELNNNGVDNEQPADNPNQIEFMIKKPQVWNGAAFAQGVSSDMLGFRMDLWNPTGKTISVRINNIFAIPASPTAADISINAPTVDGVKDVTVAGVGYIQFTIDNLNAGQLYNGTAELMKSTGNDRNYRFNTTVIPHGVVYTFLNYHVSLIGGKYYMVVNPYIGYTGTYRLMVNDHPAVTMYADGNGPIYMPLAMGLHSGATAKYQIWYTPGSTFITDVDIIVQSQITNYKEHVSAASIGIPYHFEIINHRFVMWDEMAADLDKDAKGIEQVQLRWDIASESVIKSLLDNSTGDSIILKYKLMETLEPYATNPNGTEDLSKTKTLTTIVMEISRDAAGVIKVNYSEEPPWIDENDHSKGRQPALLSKSGYWENVLPGTVDLERTFSDPDVPNNDSYRNPQTNEVIYRAFVELNTLAFNKNAIGNTATDSNLITFYYPNIYFLNTVPVQMITSPGQIDEKVENLNPGSSLYDSLTLDDFSRLEVPMPQNLTARDARTDVSEDAQGDIVTKEVSMVTEWIVPGEKVKEYFANTHLRDYQDIRFDLYISQSESTLIGLTSKPKVADRTAPPTRSIAYDPAWFSAMPSPAQSRPRIYFSDILANVGLTIPDANNNPVPLRDWLRAGNVVAITGIPLDSWENAVDNVTSGTSIWMGYTLDGLDKNQQYYFSVDMTIDYYDSADLVNPAKSENSRMVGITAETTKGAEEKPNPEDKLPPAPTLGKENIALASVDIIWNKIKEPEMVPNGVQFEYEIIRTKDTPISPEKLDTRTDFKVFYDAVKSVEKAGLQTNGAAIGVFNGSSFSPAVPSDYFYDAATDRIRLTDSTLVPNSVYFYYVRTLRIVNGKVLYSVWSAISVTTTPVNPPKNLKWERGGADIEYDAKHEFVVSFDAPLLDVSKIGREIAMEYSIREDNGEWSEPKRIEGFWHEASSEQGFTHILYKVTQMQKDGKWVSLAAGSSYAIRVRMVDLLNNDVSMYSNIAEARTNYDENEYNKNKETDEWLKYLEGELKKLQKNDYWLVKDSIQEAVIIYRPDRFDELLTRAEGSQLLLAEQGAFRTVYYLPASAVISANEKNIGFRIIAEDMEILLSPNALNTDYNEAFIHIAKQIKDRAVSDSFVRITVSRQIYQGYVDTNKPLSQQTAVSIDVVGNLRNNILFDNAILDLLMSNVMQYINNTGIGDKVRKMLDDKTSNEDMVKYVATLVKEVEKDFRDKAYKLLQNNLKSSFAVTTLATPLYLRYKGQQTANLTVKGYASENNIWISRPVVNQGGNVYSMSANAPGIFIFAGNVIYLPNIDTVQGGADMTALIVKYGLDDYLGKGSAFKLDAKVTGYMIAGVAARLMGSEATADPIEFLKTKGYTISTRINTTAVARQEAIYLLMAVYEVKTNTKVATVRITDYSQTAGVKNMTEKYIPSIRVAYQLGICADKMMDAKANLTVKELLAMLVKLQSKAKL